MSAAPGLSQASSHRSPQGEGPAGSRDQAIPASIAQGSGTTALFLLHGVGGGKQAFAANMPALADAGYHVIAWDMPGYGDSAMVDPCTTTELAHALLRLIQHVGAERNLILGHSMGGMVAQELVALWPQQVDGLVLSGTSAAFGRADGAWQQNFLQRRFAPLDAGMDMAALARQLVPSMMAPHADAQAQAHACAVMSAVPQASYRAALQAIVAFDRLDALARIAVPTLCLAGEHDRNAPPLVMQRMADRIGQGQYQCLAGVGHLANMEQPEVFNRAVLDFLRAHFPNPRRSLMHNDARVSSSTKSSRYVPPSIAGEYTTLTDKQNQLLAIASDLGRNKFAARAQQIDRDAVFPFENYADMHAAGLLRICVPEQYGGWGADFATYVMTAAEIGRHCGATALTLNMHVSSTMWTGFIADDLDMTAEQRARHEAHRAKHYKRIVQEGKIYSQPFSEGGAAAAGKAPFGTLAHKVDGGYLVNGKKIFASLAGAADYYGILCTLDIPGATQRDSLYLAVDRNADGVTVTGDWDPLGMRGTVSRNLLFKDVFVPDAELLMPEGLYAQAALRWPHMFATLSPTYMGIAQAAYDFTVSYLRAELPGMPPVKRRMYPTKQIAVAEMKVKLEQTRAIFLQNARAARVDPSKEVRMGLLAAHYSIMENANDICQLAVRTCGGQSMLKTLPLERLYRDSRCGSLMLPWTAELCIDRLGRDCLYESGERDEPDVL